ncbi:TetR/AcrR family transcriptional regulator [Rhodopirellula sp. SWK7]|uniref:TetR/AcrR family transcriptional regulator n=1 Tax=Rhodopirellula sp. SWK7 TaxID=595460 RepID=UPI00034941B7|nr:TetR/AcrR family transcriptional regulator [Rhodopirellula sp. SWK7]
MRPQRGKQKLLDAAANLFESRGYFSTTVEQITEQAGVSKGLVYNYYASKEELLVGLIESATTRMESVAESLTPSETIEDSLSKFVDNYLSFLQSERKFLKLQLSLMLMPELRDVVHEAQETRATLLLSTITGWLRDAGVDHPKGKARLFLAMLDGVALHYLCIYEQYPLRTMKSRLLQAVCDICNQSESNA